MFTNDINAKRSATMMGKNTAPKPLIECIYCGMFVSAPMMARWHGEKCKSNPYK